MLLIHSLKSSYQPHQEPPSPPSKPVNVILGPPVHLVPQFILVPHLDFGALWDVPDEAIQTKKKNNFRC